MIEHKNFVSIFSTIFAQNISYPKNNSRDIIINGQKS